MLPPWQRKSSLCSQHPSQGEASTEVPRLRVGQLRIKGTVYINETTIFLDALFRLSDMRGRASLAVFSSCAAVGRRGELEVKHESSRLVDNRERLAERATCTPDGEHEGACSADKMHRLINMTSHNCSSCLQFASILDADGV